MGVRRDDDDPVCGKSNHHRNAAMILTPVVYMRSTRLVHLFNQVLLHNDWYEPAV